MKLFKIGFGPHAVMVAVESYETPNEIYPTALKSSMEISEEGVAKSLFEGCGYIWTELDENGEEI